MKAKKKLLNDLRTHAAFVVVVIFFASLFSACNFISETPEEISVPIVKTNSASMSVSSPSSVKVNATVISDGGAPLIESGICWIEGGVLKTAEYKTSDKIDTFSIEISDLEPKKDYAFRAYAKNAVGIAYGNSVFYYYNVVSFKTPKVIIKSAENVGPNSATLVAVLMPNNKDTKASFEVFDPYEFESKTIDLPETFSGNDSIRVEFNLTGLQAGKEYAFALRANNADGETTSATSKFTTLRP